MSKSKKAGQDMLAAVEAYIQVRIEEAISTVKTASGSEASVPKKSKPGLKPKADKPAKAAKKTGGSLRDQAQAALDENRFDGRSKERKVLKEFIESKVDLRKAEGRELSVKVTEILGLPPPRKPGPKGTVAVEPKAEKKPKAAKAEAKTDEPKKPKAAKADGSLKDQAKAALDEKKFDGRSPQRQTLKAFVESEADGRSKEYREMASEVAQILGVPGPKKPGPKKGTAKATKKESTQGKEEADAGNSAESAEASSRSPRRPKGAVPRAIDAVCMVLQEKGTLNAAGVVAVLEAKGWMPDSADPKTYVNFILSQNKDKFERDESKARGHYRLKSDAEAAPAAPAKAESSKSNGKHEAAPESAPEPASTAPTELPVADDGENPFGDLDDDSVLG